MMGLGRVPSTADLQDAYAAIQSSIGLERGPLVSEVQLALWSQWTRFDPRLAEQWVAYVARLWRALAPGRLNEELARQPWPAVAGVLLEQCLSLMGARGPETRAFASWRVCVMSGFVPATGELFFIGTRAFAGKQMGLDAELATRPYLKWGYLGRDVLINKWGSKSRSKANLRVSASAADPRGDGSKRAADANRTLLPPEARSRVLRDLIASRARVTVRDYVEAAGGAVSRRQAALDLAKASGLVAVGNTRARFYRRR